MHFWKKQVQRQRLLCWLLVFTLTFQLTSVLHFHLHHVDVPEPHGHNHSIDLHSLADEHKSDVLAHIDSQEFKATAGGIVKNSLDGGLILTIAFLLVLLLPDMLGTNCRLRSITRHLVFGNIYYGLAPPLRAPPAV